MRLIFHFLLCLFSTSTAHMAIKFPEPRKGSRGPYTWRWKAQEPMNPMNPSWCHTLQTPESQSLNKNHFQVGQKIQLDIYGNAAHGGGHCSVWWATRGTSLFHKILDLKDCTLHSKQSGKNDFYIPSTMDPSCGNPGCVFAWSWTPFNSGTCEVYMTCADMLVAGQLTGPGPNDVVIDFAPLAKAKCTRVGSDHWSIPNFGRLILSNSNSNSGTTPNKPPRPIPPPTNRPIPLPTNRPVAPTMNNAGNSGSSGAVTGLSQWDNAVATFHYFSGYTACENKFPQEAPSKVKFPFNRYAAVSRVLYKKGASCGKCFEVKCASEKCCTSPGKTVVVEALDRSGEGGKHFDLNKATFDEFLSAQCGRVDVTFRRVTCDFKTGIKITAVSANMWYWEFKLDNVAGTGVVDKAYIQSDGSRAWWQCRRSYGKYYCNRGRRPYKLPLSLKFEQMQQGKSVSVTAMRVVADVSVGKVFWSEGNFQFSRRYKNVEGKKENAGVTGAMNGGDDDDSKLITVLVVVSVIVFSIAIIGTFVHLCCKKTVVDDSYQAM